MVLPLSRNLTMTAAQSGSVFSGKPSSRSSSPTCWSSSALPVPRWDSHFSIALDLVTLQCTFGLFCCILRHAVMQPIQRIVVVIIVIECRAFQLHIQWGFVVVIKHAELNSSYPPKGASLLPRADLWRLLTFHPGGKYLRRGGAAVCHEGHHDGSVSRLWLHPHNSWTMA